MKVKMFYFGMMNLRVPLNEYQTMKMMMRLTSWIQQAGAQVRR